MKNSGPAFQSIIEAALAGNPLALPHDPEGHERYDEAERNYEYYQKMPLDNLLDHVVVYLDDLILHTETQAEHKILLEKLIAQLDLYGLVLNDISKWLQLSNNILILDHWIVHKQSELFTEHWRS